MISLNSKYINKELLNNIFKYSNNTIFSIRNNTESNDIYLNKLCILVKTLKKNHKRIELFINLKSLNNIKGLLNLLNKYPYVMIHYLGFTFTYAEFIKFYYDLSKFLNSINIVKDKYNLSPLEIFLLVYDKVSNFKEYRSYPDNYPAYKQGNLKYLFNSKYTVCSDYSILLVSSLSYFGISAKDFLLTLEHYKEDEIKEEVHARVLVRLKDDKYNINGIYVSDPTWDKKSVFTHALMTNRQTTLENDLERLNIYDFFFDVTSIEEFNNKINILLNKGCSKRYIYKSFIKIIYYIDYDFYLEMKNKYLNINNIVFSDFINDMGNYVIKYCNKEIPFKIIYTTILNTYRKINNIPEEEYQKKLEKLRLKNEMDYYNSFQDNWPYDMYCEVKS